LDPAVASAVVKGFVRRPSENGAATTALSDREEEVLRLVAQGYSNKEIAGQLDISVKTVETYKQRLMEKLDLTSRVDMVRYAIHQGWLQGQ
jgi:DNA-binding NarL/FixJ family response regulator